MKKLVFLLIIAALTLACSAGQKSVRLQNSISDNQKVVSGVYRGITPCADCKGIRTEIVLDEKGEYSISRTYLGKRGGRFLDTGSYNFDNENGVITLKDKSGIIEGKYKFSEESLEMLDADGNKIESEFAEMYILRKAPEYDLIVFDPGFEYWMNTNAISIDYYSNEYIQSLNSRYSQEWNRRYMSGDKAVNSYVDYDPSKKYNKDFNFKLFMYFKYFEESTGIKLL